MHHRTTHESEKAKHVVFLIVPTVGAVAEIGIPGETQKRSVFGGDLPFGPERRLIFGCELAGVKCVPHPGESQQHISLVPFVRRKDIRQRTADRPTDLFKWNGSNELVDGRTLSGQRYGVQTGLSEKEDVVGIRKRLGDRSILHVCAQPLAEHVFESRRVAPRVDVTAVDDAEFYGSSIRTGMPGEVEELLRETSSNRLRKGAVDDDQNVDVALGTKTVQNGGTVPVNSFGKRTWIRDAVCFSCSFEGKSR